MKKWKRMAVAVVLLCFCLTLPAQAAQTKLIALTFDDGPDLTHTPQVLQALNDHRARGTFFVVGKWLPGKRALVEEMVAQGHQIANHTFSHEPLTGKTPAEIRDEVFRTADALREMTGQETFLVRPPFGLRSQAAIASVPAPVILWNRDPARGRQVPGPRMAQSVISTARDGDIILLHDTTRYNVDATVLILDALEAKGFNFVTVDELFRLRGVPLRDGVAYKRAENPDPQGWDEANLSAHWAWDAIRVMRDMGYMTGSGHGWGPNRSLTRGTAATVLWRMSGSPAPAPTHQGHRFQDVARGSGYAAPVAWAGEQGVMEGETAKRFGVDEPVTREQLYVMVARLVQRQKLPVHSGADYQHYDDDNRISPYARDSVAFLRRLGFASANDVEVFRPGDSATRAEAAELFSWYLHLTAASA